MPSLSNKKINFAFQRTLQKMSRGISAIGLLVISNTFMTIAWYGHLKFRQVPAVNFSAIWWIILISWVIALFEYMFQVPANRLGYTGFGGPYNMWQLKVIQEAISLTVFTLFTLLVFKQDTLRLNHIIGFIFLILAVYFLFQPPKQNEPFKKRTQIQSTL